MSLNTYSAPVMASITKSSNPEIPDNHKESWLALLAAAEVYSQKSGCELAILTAYKKFRSTGAEGDGARNHEGGGIVPSGSRKCDYAYHVWGQGALAESSRRYMDDIAVLHSTTALTAQRHARLNTEEGRAKLGVDVPSGRLVSGDCLYFQCPSSQSGWWNFKRSHDDLMFCFFLIKSLTGDGGGSVSPNTRLYSQSYPSIYSPAAAIGQSGNGDRDRERAMDECEKARKRTDIVDLEEEDEEEEDENLDGRRRNLNESAGRFMCCVPV